MARFAAWGGSRSVRVVAFLLAAAVGACGRQEAHLNQPAVDIKNGDTCVVCGMYITHYPGPRGEAYLSGVKGLLKFGSTRDFFAYVTRDDIVPRLQTLYVQDTARIDWTHPSNAAASFTDARTAYYVAWQPVAGEMGSTFASFAKRTDAEAFIGAHGGALLRFDQITPALVSGLTYTCPAASSPFYALAVKAKCVVKAGAMSAGTRPMHMDGSGVMPGSATPAGTMRSE